MADGPKLNKPREFYGDSQPANSYPVEHPGGGTPQRTADPATNAELRLTVDRNGAPIQDQIPLNTLPDSAGASFQSSAPPAQPEAVAEAQDYKKRFGDLMNQVGEMRRNHNQQMEEMKLMLQLNQETGRAPTAPAPIAMPPGIDPNKELKAKDLYQALPHLYTALQEGTRAQVLREVWDVTPEEEAGIRQEYPQVDNYARESDRLAFIKRAASIRRRFAVPEAQANSGAPQPAPERAVSHTVPQPEVSPVQPVSDSAPISAMELASKAYNSAKARLDSASSDLERKQILREMREARDAIVRSQGVSEEMEQLSGLRMKG